MPFQSLPNTTDEFLIHLEWKYRKRWCHGRTQPRNKCGARLWDLPGGKFRADAGRAKNHRRLSLSLCSFSPPSIQKNSRQHEKGAVRFFSKYRPRCVQKSIRSPLFTNFAGHAEWVASRIVCDRTMYYTGNGVAAEHNISCTKQLATSRARERERESRRG